MQYEVTSLISGKSFEVTARNEWSAVAKAHAILTGKKSSGSQVTWHGTHCEVSGAGRYSRPVRLGIIE